MKSMLLAAFLALCNAATDSIPPMCYEGVAMSTTCIQKHSACYTTQGCANYVAGSNAWTGDLVDGTTAACDGSCNACFGGNGCGTATTEQVALYNAALTKEYATSSFACGAGKIITSETDCFYADYIKGATWTTSVAGEAPNAWPQGCFFHTAANENAAHTWWAANPQTTVPGDQQTINGGYICYKDAVVVAPACASSTYGCCDGDDVTAVKTDLLGSTCVGGNAYANNKEVKQAVANMVKAAAGMATGLLVAVIVIPIVGLILLIICIVCCVKKCSAGSKAQA